MGEWWEERTTGEKVVLGIGLGVLVVGGIFLFGLFVKLLWNWLMPEIFGLPEISYWQGWGLLILSSILFKDFGSGSSDSKGRSDRKRKRKLREYLKDELDDTPGEADEAADGADGSDSGRAGGTKAPGGDE